MVDNGIFGFFGLPTDSSFTNNLSVEEMQGLAKAKETLTTVNEKLDAWKRDGHHGQMAEYIAQRGKEIASERKSQEDFLNSLK